MPIEANVLEETLRGAFPDATIVLTDLAGDNDHYSLEITDEGFRGKSRVEQHKMVNAALKDCLGTTLHALAIKTLIPNS